MKDEELPIMRIEWKRGGRRYFERGAHRTTYSQRDGGGN